MEIPGTEAALCNGILYPEGLLVKDSHAALILPGVIVLMCAYGDEVVGWLAAQYVETAIYQAVAPVIAWVVIGGLGAWFAYLAIVFAIGTFCFLLSFIGIVIGMLRSRDPWTE